MTDLLDTALDSLVPTFVDEHPDWPDVVARLSPEAETRVAKPAHDRLSAPRRKRDHRWRFAFAAAVVVVATCLPAIALSASVREWLGFGPHPVYNKAILVVSTPIAGNRVARVWLSPSTDGGACEFTTITPASFVAIDPTTGAMRPPTPRTRGSSDCSVLSTPVPAAPLAWMLSGITGGNPHAGLIWGHVGQADKATRVEVVWNRGRKKLRFAEGFFIGVVATIRSPAFDRLPYTVIAYNGQGHAVLRERIPTSFLYTDWKSIEPRLQQYRQDHGCSKTPTRLWQCKTR